MTPRRSGLLSHSGGVLVARGGVGPAAAVTPFGKAQALALSLSAAAKVSF